MSKLTLETKSIPWSLFNNYTHAYTDCKHHSNTVSKPTQNTWNRKCCIILTRPVLYCSKICTCVHAVNTRTNFATIQNREWGVGARLDGCGLGWCDRTVSDWWMKTRRWPRRAFSDPETSPHCQTLSLCWFNVGPASQTVDQHWTKNGWNVEPLLV